MLLGRLLGGLPLLILIIYCQRKTSDDRAQLSYDKYYMHCFFVSSNTGSPHGKRHRLLFWIWVAAMEFVKVNAASTSMTNITKPGCSSKCGNVTIPYPFGFGDPSCSLNEYFNVICNTTSYDPPRPFMLNGESDDERLEVLHISGTGQLRIRNRVASSCYNSSGGLILNETMYGFSSDSPFSFSPGSNKLTAVGCDMEGYVYLSSSFDESDQVGTSNCFSKCPDKQMVVNDKCDGIGCCQTGIAIGARTATRLSLLPYNATGSPHTCMYSFLAEDGTYTFKGFSDINDPDFMNRTIDHVPVLVDWVIGNKMCEEARKEHNNDSYVCQANTECLNYPVSIIGGYTCSCLPGYDGNPYLSPGCSDINECAGVNNCTHICQNLAGSYSCSCPQGYNGDGLKYGTSCAKKSSQLFILKLALGISLGFFSLILVAVWIHLMIKRLKQMTLRKKCFRKNGGLLLQELISSHTSVDKTNLKIFTLEVLKAATKNFSDDHVLGKGGHGIVYRGVMPKDKEVVAVKKSQMVDQNQIEEFINEIVILGQINHNNVVKILGCCLEIDVPMLVYEYVSNGTLFHHIHHSSNNNSWLDWSNCIRIAIEAATALSHLHSAVSIPIIHRDVKTSNILIDENYTAKISDFGASRLIPLDQSQLSTVVLGTLGYLDPEYFTSGYLSEKSDVYGFGIVLIELLTRQKPISDERDVTERSLSTNFVNAVQSQRLFNILDPQIVEQASAEQLFLMADLIGKCISMRGEDRPIMTQVVVELKAIKTHVPHPFELPKHHHEDNGRNNQRQGEEETDLYPIGPVQVKTN